MSFAENVQINNDESRMSLSSLKRKVNKARTMIDSVLCWQVCISGELNTVHSCVLPRRTIAHVS